MKYLFKNEVSSEELEFEFNFKGSEKQVKWANDIAEKFCKKNIFAYATKSGVGFKGEGYNENLPYIKAAVDAILEKYDDSRFWIDLDTSRKDMHQTFCNLLNSDIDVAGAYATAYNDANGTDLKAEQFIK